MLLKRPLIFLLCSLSSLAAARELLDGIVAEVNGRPILYSEVKERVEKGPLIKVSEYPATEKDAPYQRALQDAINFHVVKKHASDKDIEVSDEDVKEHIDRILEQNNITLNDLKKFLAEQGKSFTAYEEDIRDQMMLMRFRGRIIMPRVKVTGKDIDAYYLKKVGAKPEALSLTLRKIMIELPRSADAKFRTQKSELADEVYKKLEHGLAFEEAEKLYSEEKGAARGQPWTMRSGDLAPAIREAVVGLEEKAFTKPLALDGRIYIFYLAAKTLGDSREYAEKKQQLEGELRQQEMINQLGLWLQEERAKTKIRISEKAPK